MKKNTKENSNIDVKVTHTRDTHPPEVVIIIITINLFFFVCSDVISKGAERCRELFSEAYDKCYNTVSVFVAWLLCWPMKLTFICNLAQGKTTQTNKQTNERTNDYYICRK